MFFQTFRNDITELPPTLKSNLHLLPDLFSESKADNTLRKYYYGFMKFKRWATDNSIPEADILPSKPFYIALYLASLVQSSATASPITDAFYSLKWAHSIVGANEPMENFLVRTVLEGAKRKLSIPVKKKEPITPELLQKMYDKFFCFRNVYNQRSICACLLAYAGFLRISELLNLRRVDVQCFVSHVALFIEKSKTDIYRDGNWLVIARTGNPLCPVTNLELYLEWSSIPADSDSYLFTNLVKVDGRHVLRSGNKPLSYSRMRELFIECFSPFVKDIKSYGLHSLRSGGATSAARFGISDRLFKRHGRWKSVSAKDGYVKDDLSERLLVSKNLGI